MTTFEVEGGRLISHKVGFEKDKIITYGINPREDPHEDNTKIVEHSDVVGEIVLVIPHAGTVIECFSFSVGFVLLVLISVALLIINEVRRIKES